MVDADMQTASDYLKTACTGVQVGQPKEGKENDYRGKLL